MGRTDIVSSGDFCADMLESFEVELVLPEFVGDASTIKVNEQEIYSYEVNSQLVDNNIIDSNPYKPQESDRGFIVAPAYVNLVEWNNDTSTLRLLGDLPTPCHQLRIAFLNTDVQSDLGLQLMLSAYSVISPDDMCADMLESFSVDLIIDNSIGEIESVKINDKVFFP